MSALAEGIALFNDARFWHAHEAWERLWLESEGDRKQFLQGLIQLAAAYHHVSRGTYRGAVRLFDAALRRLEPFPDGYLGVGFADAVVIAARDRETVARGEPVDPNASPRLRMDVTDVSPRR